MTEAEEAARDAGWKKAQQMYDDDLLLQESAEGDYHHGWDAAKSFYQGQWVPIRSVDDLPKIAGQYYWSSSSGILINPTVIPMSFLPDDPAHVKHMMRNDAWWSPRIITPEPYTPQEKL